MKGTRYMIALLFLVSVGIFGSCKETEAPVEEPIAAPEPQPDLSTAMQKVFDDFELVGMSVALIHKGSVAWEGHYGLANVKREVPIDGATKYRIASISKTITAIALMQLYEQGLVALDEDIGTYLGWQLRNPNHPEIPITLRQLMSHTSSLRDGQGYFDFSREMVAQELPIESLFTEDGDYYTVDLFDDRKPGDFFTYTNCSWGLVASIVERASGMHFDRYCQKNIFEPIGLKANFNVAQLEDTDKLAALYRYENGAWNAQVDDYTETAPVERRYGSYNAGRNGLLFGPQGSLRASTDDLIAIAKLFFNRGTYNGNTILSAESIDKMTAREWVFSGANGDTWEGFFNAYGLGIHCVLNAPKRDIIFPDRKMIGHPGIAYGLLSDLYIDPASESGVVFITNGSKKEYKYGKDSSFYGVEEAVFKQLYPYLKTLESANTVF